MNTISLKAPVGAPPSKNLPDDVKAVQALLLKVSPPLAARPVVNGVVDHATARAISEFQRRFMNTPDGRVDPDKRTLWHLNEGFVSSYVFCSREKKLVIDKDMITAQRWLDLVKSRLSRPADPDLKQKLKNIFHIDVNNPADKPRLVGLLDKFSKLRDSLSQPFPLQCEAKEGMFAAWVDASDPTGTMHFNPGYFREKADVRASKIIHERSHTILKIAHAGMAGAGQLNFGVAPDEDNSFTYAQAIANSYCYEWFSLSVQPGYVSSFEGATITVHPRR